MKNKREFIIAIIFLLIGLVIAYIVKTKAPATISPRMENSSTTQNPKEYTVMDINNWYLLEVPSLNFKIKFPKKPNFNRTDGKDFTRYSWSYIDEDGNSLFLHTENNLYAYDESQEIFIEKTAKIYGGIVDYSTKDSNISATTYQISGIYSDSTQDTDTIVGKIIDVGDWTFVIKNQFSKHDKYPAFISTFEVIK